VLVLVLVRTTESTFEECFASSQCQAMLNL